MLEELVRMLDADAERFHFPDWEVFEILCDDDLGMTLRRRCRHMPVLWVIGHLLDQWFVIFHPTIRKVFPQRGYKTLNEPFLPLQVFAQGMHRFFDDPF